MTWFFLIAFLLLRTGQTATADVQAFTSFEACDQAGLALAAYIRSDSTIKQAVWQCLSVDFDALDPVPGSPTPVPGNGRAA